jgi:aldose 1-epimerase
MADTSATTLELRAGELRLALRPDIGGAIAGFWLGDLPVMRSAAPESLESVRQSASFPLVPYSNRLGYRRFQWNGQHHTTEPNFPDSPHSLHGVGWQRAWQVVESGDRQAVLRYTHQPDADWPFAFEAEQLIELGENALDLRLAARNLSDTPAPMGLGWHPYFPKRTRSRIHAELTGRWEADATKLPTRQVVQAGVDATVAHLDYDHCFEGWTGAARLRDEKLSLKLTSSLSRLVVFTPPERDYYAVEPVSHVNNAIHMADPLAHGLVALAPGASTDAWMTLEVARA